MSDILNSPAPEAACTGDCCVPAERLPVVSHAELIARTQANSSTLLASLLGVAPVRRAS